MVLIVWSNAIRYKWIIKCSGVSLPGYAMFIDERFLPVDFDYFERMQGSAESKKDLQVDEWMQCQKRRGDMREIVIDKSMVLAARFSCQSRMHQSQHS